MAEILNLSFAPMDPSVPVYLEPEVLAALLAWLKRIGAVRS